MPIDLPDSVTRSIDLTNDATPPIAVDADSLPTYAITLPDGTPGTAPTVQHGVTGEYYVVYTATVSGPHKELWTATVGGVTVVIDRNFTVEQRGTSFVDTDEALAHLRASGVITEPLDLEELRWLCLVACDAVERDRGLVLARRTVTDTFDGGRTELKLRKRPPRPGDGGTITMTSLTESGITLTEGTDFVVRRNRWTIMRGTSTSRRCWAWGIENIAATYVVSCNPIPIIARHVALDVILRVWQVTQQMPHPALDDVSTDFAVFAATASLTQVQKGAYDALTPGLYA